MVNMCKAFDDWTRDIRLEGKLEGEEQMGKLSQNLISAGQIDDLLQAINNRKYRQKLMIEFGIV